MGRFCGVFYRVAQITLFLPPTIHSMYEDTQSGPRSRSVSGHGAMNVYGRQANTRSATDTEDIRPSYRFEVSPAE